jgi:hypothetical protein
MKRLFLIGAALLAFASTAFAQLASPINQAVPVKIVSGDGGGSGGGLTTSGPAVAGVSANGTVGTTSTTLVPAGHYTGWVTIENTSTTGTLFVSFKATTTTTDFAIAPGAAMTFPFGPTNALTGIGSAAGVTWSAVGY